MRVAEFQALMRTLYLRNDRRRGLARTFLWLVEEVGEVAEALKGEPVDVVHLAEELADVVAWTCSVANVAGVDLEEALRAKYPGKCPKCGGNPCTCLEPLNPVGGEPGSGRSEGGASGADGADGEVEG